MKLKNKKTGKVVKIERKKTKSKYSKKAIA